MESLLGPFVNVGGVLIKCPFIVYGGSEVFEVVADCLVMDGGGDQSRWRCV